MKKNEGNAAVAVAIVLAGIFVALAIVVSTAIKVPTEGQEAKVENEQVQEDQELAKNSGPDKVRPIDENDHIYGDPNAPVKIIEFSDFECPFCARLHSTLKTLVNESQGQIAWVYRNFPLEQLHPEKAFQEAVASECAAELGGNDAFWTFSDRFFELTPSNNQTNLSVVIPQIINEIGLDEDKFNECLASGRYDDRIKRDIQDAVTSGGNGTPYSVIVGPNGKATALSGAQPIEAFRQVIDSLLN